VDDEKKGKSAELVNVLTRVTGKQVRVTAVIVSSMGAVYVPSMKNLQKVLKCNDRELKKLARRMFETVIVGSMEIWRQTTRTIGAGMNDEVNRLIEEEAVLAEEAGAAMEVEEAVGAGAGAGSEVRSEARSEGEARSEAGMDARMEDVELEEEDLKLSLKQEGNGKGRMKC
jgi:hypothetical protein